ncbi:winged helix-turn-helix transcriptional regulator [Bradyrhizobium sp. INPA01-394B]|jgi:MarR family transcriptional regulator for hemolysin|uniref:Winged helix-turn-helix transcriptional regulator n=1 Tax=Bradyrhizobium campsiandrae TaxID=1729892 RepID=A0ABR7U4Z4_9BRAD|nr:MarR family winged helix-turn-helix transcriptional regulator [Bradyrhizobium campsiandrae]MBC9881414.1 winged helix-turn-helix transcriptional regulator [Bradyrhizobium campsiandrae]MBC9979045.1 winged helix-turn-helix transcriptional regulator [Bradyrhizobium campsiandrae]
MNDLGPPRFCLTSTLLEAGRQWRRLAQRVLVEHQISEARATVLLWVRRLGGVRQVTLADYVGIQGTSLVRLLDELSTLNLIERRDDREDRRVNLIWLTPAGEPLAVAIERSLSELREEVLSDVSDADVEATLRVFRAIDRADENSRTQPAPLLTKAIP